MVPARPRAAVLAACVPAAAAFEADPAPRLSLSVAEQEEFTQRVFAEQARAYSRRNASALYADDGDLVWVDAPGAWHQQMARIVDHRFFSFDETRAFAVDARKAGVSALMLVQIQKTAACPGGWYNGLQLCDHINGSYPAADGSLAQWRSMLDEIKPMRLMWWTNPDYWSTQGGVWAEAKANKESDVGKWFTWGPESCEGVEPCDSSRNVVVPGVGCAQGSWCSEGRSSGTESALASFGSAEYADYMVDAMANSWTRNLGIDGYCEDCSANYGCMGQTGGKGSLPYWKGIVERVQKLQPQVAMSGEGYSSWAEMIQAGANIGGQGFKGYHTAMQGAVFNGDASNLEDVASTSGADGATVLCYLHPAYDGKQPGACPTMYFRDATATIKDIKQHRLWVTLEAGSGIVPQHDYDPGSTCEGWGKRENGCPANNKGGAWWNVTNDPFDDGAESPLWAFGKYRALNRLALRTKLGISSAGAAARGAVANYTEYPHENCYNGHGGRDIDGTPTVGLSAEQCKQRCDADDACSCVTYQADKKDCWKRAGCQAGQFEKTSATEPFTVYVKSGYDEYAHENCYQNHGGQEIDSSPAKGLSVAQCTQRCDDDASCDCVVYYAGDGDGGVEGYDQGDCWKRAECTPGRFENNTKTVPFTVYVKRNGPRYTPAPPPPAEAGGALAYLKHDALGPDGDACVMVFNPGPAQRVTVDLSALPAALLGGAVVPHDLLDPRNATGPPLAAAWTVAMGAGEARAFGGFALSAFAPRAGKKGGCNATYSRPAQGATLQACFLECLGDSRCENVFLEYRVPKWMEKPPAARCTLLGAVEDPSSACAQGTGTLVKRLAAGRPRAAGA